MAIAFESLILIPSASVSFMETFHNVLLNSKLFFCLVSFATKYQRLHELLDGQVGLTRVKENLFSALTHVFFPLSFLLDYQQPYFIFTIKNTFIVVSKYKYHIYLTRKNSSEKYKESEIYFKYLFIRQP